MKLKKAFTLLEILLVVAGIAILAGIVILAVNPTRQLAQARNSQRSVDVNTINKALYQYVIDKGSLPATVSTTPLEICRSGAASCSGLVDLSALTDSEVYLTAMPSDPLAGSANGTGYMIYKTAFGRPGVFSPLAELGEQISTGQSFICGQSLIDPRDAQAYTTVQIGTQCWTGQNMNVGTAVAGSVEQSNNSILEKYCYGDNSVNCTVYGGLYQWDEAMQYGPLSPGAQGLCPDGWHIPSDDDWTALTRFAINDLSCNPDSGCPPAGTNLQVGGYFKFDIPLAGYRNLDGSFYNLGASADLWSSSINGSPWERYLVSGDPGIYPYTYDRGYGVSVRCVANESVVCAANCSGRCGGYDGCTGTCPNTCIGAQVCSANTCHDPLTLVYTAGVHGSISGSSAQTVSYGGNGSVVTAVADSGYLFFNWSDGSTDNPRTETNVLTNISLTANFIVNPCGVASSLTDSRDSQVYPIVPIGNQCWMAKNLNVGNMISSKLANNSTFQNQTDNGILEKFCYGYVQSGNTSQQTTGTNNCNIYGGLYEWNEAMQYSTTESVQGICPAGWHVPSHAEWNTMTDYLGGAAVAGGKLKEVGTTHWSLPNTGATNSTGFNGLPGGKRYSSSGGFSSINLWGDFWTSSLDGTLSQNRALGWGSATVNQGSSLGIDGFSIRCVKN